MLDKKRKDRDKLVFCELVAERVQVFDGVDDEDRVDRTRSRLEVAVNVLAEEVYYIDEDVD